MLQQSDLSRVANLLAEDRPSPASIIPKTFEHTLARGAKVWRSRGADGSERNILVVITTLVLTEGAANFKADKVAKLSDAARSWSTAADGVEGFVLINRSKDWD